MQYGNTVWQKGQSVSASGGKLQTVYSILDNKRFSVSPSLGLEIDQRSYVIGDTLSTQSTWVLMPSVGLQIDCKINAIGKKEKERLYCIADKEEQNVIIRAFISYYPLGLGCELANKGSFISLNLGFGVSGKPARRVKTNWH